ncbi:MAG: response regulator [Bacteroidales bacterium]|nr:response regulator [Bacteroidales bacterium]
MKERSQQDLLYEIEKLNKKVADLEYLDKNSGFQELVEMLPEIIFQTDESLNITYVNKKGLDLLGYTFNDLSHGLNGFDMLTPSSKEKAQKYFSMRQKGIDAGVIEYVALKKNGSTFPILFHAKSIRRNEKFEGLIGVIVDITEQKKLENELIQAKIKAEESDNLKSAFLANLSHEIRTPMNGILGFTSLLNEPDISSKRKKEFIEIIQKSGQRMLNTVDDIVEISKIETGQLNINLVRLNIKNHLVTLYNFFSLEAKNKGLQFYIDKTLKDEESEILTDKYKLSSVISNLIKNSIKFTDAGGVIVMGLEKKEDKIEFFIKDNGIGIPLCSQKAIFKRFVKADTDNKRVYEGSGLGLSIAKSFIELLGGKIWVESGSEQGSTFKFNIPYDSGKNEQLTAQLETEITVDEFKNRALKILIVEDDEINRMFFSTLLNGYCKELTEAENGKEAVEICKKDTNIDLVFMDIKMPVMDGFEATKEIRKFNNDIKIIAQTGYVLGGDKEKILASGFDGYISKPIQKEKLETILKKF